MIKLWKENIPYWKEEFGQEIPSLDYYPAKGEDKIVPAVIICPGGAYLGRAYHEGEPVAWHFQENGIAAFVLHYRVNPYSHPAMLCDALRAIRYVRANAGGYGIDPEKIFICGFSAGGHLAMTAALHYDYPFEKTDEIDRVSAKPNGAILCYPVITLGEYTHKETREVFLKGCNFDKKVEWDFSGENAVRHDSPPMFLWHTANDGAVPVENTLQMAMALRKNNVPSEVHIFPDGAHGLGLANGKDGAPYNPYVAEWGKLCVKWIKQ